MPTSRLATGRVSHVLQRGANPTGIVGIIAALAERASGGQSGHIGHLTPNRRQHGPRPRVLRQTFEQTQRIRMPRSEEHTSELQSLMRISYAVFCLKQNTQLRYTSRATARVLTVLKT